MTRLATLLRLLAGHTQPDRGRLEMLEQRDAEVRGQAAVAVDRAKRVLSPGSANQAQAIIRATARQRPAGK